MRIVIFFRDIQRYFNQTVDGFGIADFYLPYRSDEFVCDFIKFGNKVFFVKPVVVYFDKAVVIGYKLLYFADLSVIGFPSIWIRNCLVGTVFS